MNVSQATRSFEELTLGKGASLEELVDREALGELAKAFYGLFRLSLRIYAQDGTLLADASDPEPIYGYLSGFRQARIALQEVVAQVKAMHPGPNGETSYACITGAVYRVVSIDYDAREVGRLIVGPFLPPAVTEVPPTLLSLDPELDARRVRDLLGQMPCVREDTVGQVIALLRRSLDLILFSGHKALLASQMHLASVWESYHALKDKNDKLQEAYSRLKELDRLKSNFLATVSHELRTPLTSIIGYSEMLVGGIVGDLGEEQREFVQTIREKGEQLLSLIKGLLDLSKLESGTLSLRRTQIDLGIVLNDVHQTMTPHARRKGVELKVEMTEEVPCVWADGDRLRQVVLNLVENAIKFTPPRGRVVLAAAPVTLGPVGEQDGAGRAFFGARRVSAEIRVTDTGIGIPVGERDRVCDAFYQVDSSSTREQGGAGLGLSIVKRLVEAHDGTIRIEDNHPQGTVFIVALPGRRGTLV
ncbi:ATP-binding protein [Myxococcota bacterium]